MLIQKDPSNYKYVGGAKTKRLAYDITISHNQLLPFVRLNPEIGLELGVSSTDKVGPDGLSVSDLEKELDKFEVFINSVLGISEIQNP